jgi:uncharacterized protein (TIGR02145 family)
MSQQININHITMKKFLLYSALLSFGYICKAQTVTDIDGNVYNTVAIGTQVWMRENLKTTHYENGTAIPLVTGNSNWAALTITSKAYCWYNDDIANKETNGALYTWAAAMNGSLSSVINPSGIQGVCPTGWHLPSDAEWSVLENYLADNGYNFDGSVGGGRGRIAKSLASISGWESFSTIGGVGNTDYSLYRNKSGYTAFPGGFRYDYGGFVDIGKSGWWWCATEYDASYVWDRHMGYSICYVGRSESDKKLGLSVRCVKNDIVNSNNSLINDNHFVFPNPANDELFIANNDFSNVLVSISDLQGRLILSKSINSTSIDISNLSSGVYLVKISISGNVNTYKIVKR